MEKLNKIKKIKLKQLIYDNLKPGVSKEMIRKADVLDYVRNHEFDVLVILGAGDLDNEVPQITKLLKNRINDR